MVKMYSYYPKFELTVFLMVLLGHGLTGYMCDPWNLNILEIVCSDRPGPIFCPGPGLKPGLQ